MSLISVLLTSNAPLVALVPKKRDALDITDYRPISLVGSAYKIISKLLADRLKKVVGKVVSHSQNAFAGVDRFLMRP